MKNCSRLRSRLPWLAAWHLFTPQLLGAPLIWFPGPAVNPPFSGAAAVTDASLGNVIIGGDGYANYDYALTYPENLVATNLYWAYLPALDTLQIAPGAAASGGLILLYGGTDGIHSQSTVTGYSPSGDTPLALASMSVPRSQLGYASDASGNAYAIGGLDDTGRPLASAERFNLDASAWTALPSLPAGRYDFPAVFDHTNLIYIFGGRTNTTSGGEIASVLRYSTRSNNWTAVAPLPVATAGSAAAFGKDGKIYVAGGVGHGITTNLVQVYDPGANSWTLSTPLPEALAASAMSVDSLGRLIVMGGTDASGNDVGDVWRSQEFGVPDTAPEFTQYPGTNTVYLQPYSSTINATGNPQPTYTLLSGPVTMAVDSFSGVITWTPADAGIGTNSVTIEASNAVGSTNWTFTLIVPNPPPAPVTNLALVGVTDNSVTLSWTPESPVVGPVSYAVFLRHSIHDPKGSGGTVWYAQISDATTLPYITVSGLTPGLSQDYYVVATAPGGSSGYTSAIGATTTAPQGPASIGITAITPTTVSLAWTPAPGPAGNPLYSAITSYTIMERNTAYSPPLNVPTATNLLGTNGTVTGLTPGQSHLWFVSGVDAAGNASALGSAYVIVTNPPPPRFTAAPAAGPGGFQFSATEPGAMMQTVTIQATTNPADPSSWVPIGTFISVTNPFTFTDTNAALFPSRFYRILSP